MLTGRNHEISKTVDERVRVKGTRIQQNRLVSGSTSLPELQVHTSDEGRRQAAIRYRTMGKVQKVCTSQGLEAQKGNRMKIIEFKYKDEFTDGEWRYQACVVSSVEECKKLYGLGADCEFEILSVEEVEE